MPPPAPVVGHSYNIRQERAEELLLAARILTLSLRVSRLVAKARAESEEKEPNRT